MKCRASYPKLFTSLAMALGWFAGFVDFNNNEHMRFSLEYVTPSQRRSGLDFDILAKRYRTLELARERNPLRWGSRKARVYKNTNEVILKAVRLLILQVYYFDKTILTVGEYLKRWGFTPQKPAKVS